MNLKNKWLSGATISAALISGLIAFEGEKFKPYKDIGGVPTVCVGHTGKDINMDKIYTDKECRVFLIADIQKHGNGVLQCINVPIKQEEYDAYTMFAFNVGVGAFCSSRAARLLNGGLHNEACVAISTGPTGKPAWSFVDGKYVAGLYRRRQFETKMCLGEIK